MKLCIQLRCHRFTRPALSNYLLSAGNGQESAPGQPSGASRETQICHAVAHAHANRAAGLQTNLQQQVCRARNKHGRRAGRRRARRAAGRRA